MIRAGLLFFVRRPIGRCFLPIEPGGYAAPTVDPVTAQNGDGGLGGWRSGGKEGGGERGLDDAVGAVEIACDLSEVDGAGACRRGRPRANEEIGGMRDPGGRETPARPARP